MDIKGIKPIDRYEAQRRWRGYWDGHTDDFASYVLYKVHGSDPDKVGRAMHDAWAFARLYQIDNRDVYDKVTKFGIRSYTDVYKYGYNGSVMVGNLMVPREQWIRMMVPYERLDDGTRDLIKAIPATVFENFHYNASTTEKYPKFKSSDGKDLNGEALVKAYVTYIENMIRPIIQAKLILLNQKQPDGMFLTNLYNHARIQDFIFGLYGRRAIDFAKENQATLGFSPDVDVDVKAENAKMQREIALYASTNVDAVLPLIWAHTLRCVMDVYKTATPPFRVGWMCEFDPDAEPERSNKIIQFIMTYDRLYKLSIEIEKGVPYKRKAVADILKDVKSFTNDVKINEIINKYYNMYQYTTSSNNRKLAIRKMSLGLGHEGSERMDAARYNFDALKRVMDEWSTVYADLYALYDDICREYLETRRNGGETAVTEDFLMLPMRLPSIDDAIFEHNDFFDLYSKAVYVATANGHYTFSDFKPTEHYIRPKHKVAAANLQRLVREIRAKIRCPYTGQTYSQLNMHLITILSDATRRYDMRYAFAEKENAENGDQPDVELHPGENRRILRLGPPPQLPDSIVKLLQHIKDDRDNLMEYDMGYVFTIGLAFLDVKALEAASGEGVGPDEVVSKNVLVLGVLHDGKLLFKTKTAFVDENNKMNLIVYRDDDWYSWEDVTDQQIDDRDQKILARFCGDVPRGGRRRPAPTSKPGPASKSGYVKTGAVHRDGEGVRRVVYQKGAGSTRYVKVKNAKTGKFRYRKVKPEPGAT